MAFNKNLYDTYQNMIRRCYDPNHMAYPRYGAKGVTVCARWRESWLAFRVDMGDKPTPKHTIERKDNTLGYTPANCRWATTYEQARNRRNNVLLTAFGETKHQQDWVSDPRCIVDIGTLRNRLKRGMGHEEAMTLKIPHGRFGGYITAWGESKGVVAWTRDPRCAATREQIKARLRGGVSAEEAMSVGCGYIIRDRRLLKRPSYR